jgi:hypothetical protein
MHTHTYDELRMRIPLLGFAQANGYVLNRRKGVRWPVLEHASGDRVILVNAHRPGNDGYFNPEREGDKGTIVQFVAQRLGWLFPKDPGLSVPGNVNRILHDWLQLPYHERRYQAKAALPSRHGAKVAEAIFNPALLTPLTDLRWLLGRGIRKATLRLPPFRDQILEYRSGGHLNTAFPYRRQPNGPIVGAELRNPSFKGHMPGSFKARSLWMSTPPVDAARMLICESALDALSHYELERDDRCVYVSFGGHLAQGQLKALQELRERLSTTRTIDVCLGIDADEAGDRYAHMLTAQFPDAQRLKPEGKDFNEMLQRSRKGIARMGMD